MSCLNRIHTDFDTPDCGDFRTGDEYIAFRKQLAEYLYDNPSLTSRQIRESVEPYKHFEMILIEIGEPDHRVSCPRYTLKDSFADDVWLSRLEPRKRLRVLAQRRKDDAEKRKQYASVMNTAVYRKPAKNTGPFSKK